MKSIIITTYPHEDPPYDIPCGVYANDDIKIAIICGENDSWVIYNLKGERLPETEGYGLIEDAVSKLVELIRKRKIPFFQDLGVVDTIDGKRLVQLLVLPEAIHEPGTRYALVADDNVVACDFLYDDGQWTITCRDQQMPFTTIYKDLREAIAVVLTLAKKYPLLVRKSRSGNLRSVNRIFGKQSQ